MGGYQRRGEFWRVLLDTDVDCRNGVHCAHCVGTSLQSARARRTDGHSMPEGAVAILAQIWDRPGWAEWGSRQ